MATKTKIELILELNNRIKTGLSSAKSQLNSELGGMQSRIAQFSSSSRRNLREFANEIPAVGAGFRAMANPIGLATVGISALTAGLIKATDRAAEFNHEFRDLANLNLDKTQGELIDLQKLVLKTAWKKGFNASDTSSAYNEIQSTIGLYGNEARPIIEKQGEFAKVMNANMGEYVAGTAKAMANWRFGVDKLDAFNKSAYATMQVGVVSFEQLSQVQSVYAGAAASIKQDFDTANKLFSLFTIKTKSVDEAATLTKSLFNDLTKKSTINAFRKIGIDFYDINGQLKQADTIMLELNDKFMKLKNDKSIIALKNQFKGSEGLIAMIQAATDRSGELKKTFDEFANSKMNLGNALDIAQNDIVYRQEQLANRIDNLIIRMGQALLPAKEWLVDKATTAVNRIDWAFKSTDEKRSDIQAGQKESVYDKYADILASAKTMSDSQYNKYVSALETDIKKYQSDYEAKTKSYQNVGFLGTPILSHFKGYEDKLQRLDERNNYTRQYDLARSKAFKSLLYDLKEARNNKDDEIVKTSTTGSSNNPLSNLNDTINRVVGAGQAPRNITVNIDAFNKGGINTENTSLQKMDASQIEDWFTEMCMRAVRNVELSN